MGISTVIPTAIKYKNKKLVYRYAGKGNHKNTIVLIHGFCEDYHIWDTYTEALSAKYQVIAPDLPGFGRSEVQEEISIEEMATGVQAILQREKIEQAVIVGHSMGGYAGIAFAELYPEMLRGLILFHSTTYADDEEKHKKRTATIKSFEKYGTKPYLTGFFPALFTQSFAQQNPEVVAAVKVRANRLTPQALIAATNAMMYRPDRSEVLQTIACPVSFIIGKQDAFVPYQQNLKECYLAPRAHLSLLADVGHAGMFEAPEKTLAIVTDFVRYCDMK